MVETVQVWISELTGFSNIWTSSDWHRYDRELKTLGDTEWSRGPANLYQVLPFQSGGWWGWFTWWDLIKTYIWLSSIYIIVNVENFHDKYEKENKPGRSNLGDHRTHSPLHLPENEFQITPPWEWVQWSIFKARWRKLDPGFSSFPLLWDDGRTCSVLMFLVKELSS